MAVPIPLPRTARITVPVMRGKDIEAHGRALIRYVDPSQLDEFTKKSSLIRRTYGAGKRNLAILASKKAKLPQYGIVGPNLYHAMRIAGAYDAFADSLLMQYMTPSIPSLIYPLDRDWHSYSGGYIHETGGIKGNYALDFLTPPGTPVLAMESGTISRTAGHDPDTGVHGDNRDVFGWSIYLKVKTGFYYGTHMGQLFVKAGEKVKVGQEIGQVGHWPHDIGRSHLHLGFTHITHISYLSKKRILAVASAPRVDGINL